MSSLLAAATLSLLAAAVLSPAAPADTITRGRAVAEARCGACHMIGLVGDSPTAGAPPFRDLHKQYPVADLVQALSEGAAPSHAGMPPFRLSPRQTKDLIAYLHWVERQDVGPSPR